MKCMDNKRGEIIPIFYDVNPGEVREQTGYYGDAFAKHESQEDYKKVESWRNALVAAGKLFGWSVGGIANGFEAKGIKLIVDTISERLYPKKGFIRTQTRLEDVEHLAIPLEDIYKATDHFADKNIIAGGGFGKVYRGQSHRHGIVAVKRLDRRYGQGDNEFMVEVSLLTTYQNENIVSLAGYCDESDEKILVYRYERNGSLDNHLSGNDLKWIQRLQICLDVACGLKYLHDDAQRLHRIVHRDIKSSNILLDENWKAKISDFGLSKIALANEVFSIVMSNPCGTPGYVDPQYREHNILTQKSDVYSFGVVLFEVLFGRLVNDIPTEYYDEYRFSDKLAQNHYEKKILDRIIDPGLRTQMNSESLSTFSAVAYQCLKKRREERPKMTLVVDQLKRSLEYQQIS